MSSVKKTGNKLGCLVLSILLIAIPLVAVWGKHVFLLVNTSYTTGAIIGKSYNYGKTGKRLFISYRYWVQGKKYLGQEDGALLDEKRLHINDTCVVVFSTWFNALSRLELNKTDSLLAAEPHAQK